MLDERHKEQLRWKKVIERRWLRIDEAALYMSTTPKNFRKWTDTGKIPASCVCRIPGRGKPTIRIDKLGLDEILEQWKGREQHMISNLKKLEQVDAGR